MSEKAKRKTSDAPSWILPKPFRYEIKGELRDLIDAIEALHQEQYSWKKYIVTVQQPLDESRLYQFEVVSTFVSPKSSTKAKLQGSIHQEGTKFIVEGFARVDLSGEYKMYILGILTTVLISIVIEALPKPGGLEAGIFLNIVMLILLGIIFISSLAERDKLIEYLLKSLETYTPTPFGQNAQTPLQPETNASICAASD